MVEAFCQLVEYYLEKGIAANIDKDLDLTKSQFANFQKLRYFGIAYNIESGWLPSMKGMDFYHGKIRINSTVATMNNEVLPDDHEAWETHTRSIVRITINEVLPYYFKSKTQYQAEKSPQLSLFT